MDPSRKLCQIQDSFNSPYLSSLSLNKLTKTVYSLKSSSHPMSPRTFRNSLFEKGRSYKNLELPSFQGKLSEKAANPFNNFNDSIKLSSSNNFNDSTNHKFKGNDLILANIDAIYNFTGQEDGYLSPQYIKEYDYVDLDGKYLKYLQYRLPASKGFTKCSVNESDYLDKRFINSSKGRMMTSLINANCDNKDIISYTRSVLAEGVDLVISHSTNLRKNLLNALQLLKPNGCFVSRIEKIDLPLFYIAALNFQNFSLFKPISENLNNDYFYLIGEEFKGSSMDWVTILKEKTKEEEEIEISIPADFLSYVFNYNNSLMELKKQLYENPVEYNLYKCKALWNIF